MIAVDGRQREHPSGVLRDFDARMAQAAGVANAAEARLVALTAEALREHYWEGWRIHTANQWLRWKAGVGGERARQIVRLASRSDELPTTIALHAQGRLSLEQAATVARYTPAEYEASVASLALVLTVQQIVQATATYGFDLVQHERDAKADAQRRPRGPRREMTFGPRSSDEWSLRAVLPADEGAIVEEALRDQRDRLHRHARDAAKDAAAAEGRPTTGTDAELGVASPTWADALVGVAKVAATSNEDGDSVADRVGVLLHLQAPGPDEGDADRWRAQMQGGPTLPAALRRYLTCDCDIQVVWEQDGTPVQVGRTHRSIPRRIRRLVLHRDHGTCRVPGCTRRTGLHLHHVTHWEDAGETVTWNIITVCGTHHRQHHNGWLGITGNADATTGPDVVRFTTRTGETLSPAGTPTPPGPDDLPDVAPYVHPSGERLHGWHVTYDRYPRHHLIRTPGP